MANLVVGLAGRFIVLSDLIGSCQKLLLFNMLCSDTATIGLSTLLFSLCLAGRLRIAYRELFEIGIGAVDDLVELLARLKVK